MAFDPTKPVRTRDGRAVRILATDLPPPYVIGGHVENFSNLDRWMEDGSWLDRNGPDDLDLINTPERHVRWLVVTPLSGSTDKETARMSARAVAKTTSSVALVRIEFEEGEGLD